MYAERIKYKLCNLPCLQMDSIPLSSENIFRGQYSHLQKVLCLIDPVEISEAFYEIESNYIVMLSVSNDGFTFSEDIFLVVYDGFCWDCDHTICTQKVLTGLMYVI